MRRKVAACIALVGILSGAGRGGAQTAQNSPLKSDPDRANAAKEKNDKALASNALLEQINAATQNKQWQQAADLLKQLIAMNPDTWTYRQSLGGALLSLGQYDEAVNSYDTGIKLAQTELSSKAPDTDIVKTKAGIAAMLTSEGNAYLKEKKNDLAVAAYGKAAELTPNPALAYFNICAVQYNTGNANAAMPACDRAIAADPNKADAYFIKGSLLIADSKVGAQGKMTAPPGAVEALKKYLELAPSGPHADDVKAMLDFVGAKQ
jgi:tetratricopeptide (TPR) repeat protein